MATDVVRALCGNVTDVSALRLTDREGVRGDADLIGDLTSEEQQWEDRAALPLFLNSRKKTYFRMLILKFAGGSNSVRAGSLN